MKVDEVKTTLNPSNFKCKDKNDWNIVQNRIKKVIQIWDNMKWVNYDMEGGEISFNVSKLYHFRQYLTMCQKEVTLEQNARVSKHAFKG